MLTWYLNVRLNSIVCTNCLEKKDESWILRWELVSIDLSAAPLINQSSFNYIYSSFLPKTAGKTNTWVFAWAHLVKQRPRAPSAAWGRNASCIGFRPVVRWWCLRNTGPKKTKNKQTKKSSPSQGAPTLPSLLNFSFLPSGSSFTHHKITLTWKTTPSITPPVFSQISSSQILISAHFQSIISFAHLQMSSDWQMVWNFPEYGSFFFNSSRMWNANSLVSLCPSSPFGLFTRSPVSGSRVPQQEWTVPQRLVAGIVSMCVCRVGGSAHSRSTN